MKIITSALLVLLFPCFAMAQLGKMGTVALTGNAIVNEYTTLTADVSSGDVLITAASNTLNANNRFPAVLAPGDLLLFIQMQGATIGTANDSTYGEILNYNNCGNYDWAEVASVGPNNTITLACGLQNNYTATGKVQIIRVPRYENLTLNSGCIVSAPSWNGQTGGIVVIETNSNLTFAGSGQIDVSGKGFRPGNSQVHDGIWDYRGFVANALTFGAEKGESIAGFTTDYDIIGGRYGRGAPANGGGGGNSHNTGGGGGANAGDIALWTGKGNPSLSNANWAAAWNLQSPGFATSTSSGGGQGGNSFSDSNQNALTVPTSNSLWGGDWRRNQGGRGGHPLDTQNGKIFFGGGGGGGDQNNNFGGNGGAGGGIVLLRNYGNLVASNSAYIKANGANGVSTTSTFLSGGTDGAGGGGGGGTVVFSSSNLLNNTNLLRIEAKGGNGGNQSVSGLTTEAEGPGGGGGGGLVAVSGTLTNVNVAGGANGTTNSSGLLEFPPNGATAGGAGLITEIDQLIRIKDDIAKSSSCGTGEVNLQLNTPEATLISWSDSLMGVPLATIAGFSTTISITRDFYLTACPFQQTQTVEAVFLPLPIVDAGNDIQICAGQTFQLQGTGNGNIFSWFPAQFLDNSLIPNPIASGIDSVEFFLTVIDTNNCINFDSVLVTPGAEISVTASSDTTICAGNTITLQASGASTYEWTSPGISLNGAAVALNTDTTIVLELLASNGNCVARDTVTITVNAPQSFSLQGEGFVCEGQNAQITAEGAVSACWITGLDTLCNASNSFSFVPTDSIFVTAITTDANGCNTTTAPILVGPISAPVADFSYNQISNYEVVFTNNSIGNTSNKWLMDNQVLTQASPIYDFPYNDFFQVTLIIENACGSDTITKLIQVIKQLGFEDIKTNNFTIYPNPAVSFFQLKSKFNDIESIEIFDAIGKLVVVESKLKTNQPISIKNLTSGIYTVVVNINGKKEVEKLVIYN
jgi:hypothetical protein